MSSDAPDPSLAERLDRLTSVFERLAQAMTLQAESIDRLAASNEALADLAVQGEEDSGHDFHLDGSPVKQ